MIWPAKRIGLDSCKPRFATVRDCFLGPTWLIGCSPHASSQVIKLGIQTPRKNAKKTTQERKKTHSDNLMISPLSFHRKLKFYSQNEDKSSAGNHQKERRGYNLVLLLTNESNLLVSSLTSHQITSPPLPSPRPLAFGLSTISRKGRVLKCYVQVSLVFVFLKIPSGARRLRGGRSHQPYVTAYSSI